MLRALSHLKKKLGYDAQNVLDNIWRNKYHDPIQSFLMYLNTNQQMDGLSTMIQDPSNPETKKILDKFFNVSRPAHASDNETAPYYSLKQVPEPKSGTLERMKDGTTKPYHLR